MLILDFIAYRGLDPTDVLNNQGALDIEYRKIPLVEVGLFQQIKNGGEIMTALKQKAGDAFETVYNLFNDKDISNKEKHDRENIDEDYQKVKAAEAWSDTENSNPLKDMRDWVEDFKIRYGVTLGYAVMTSKTFSYIANNKNVIKQLYPTVTDPSGLMIRNEQVKQLVLDTVGVRILINNNI